MALSPQQARAIRDTVEDPVEFVSKFLGMDCWGAQARMLRLLDKPYSRTVVKSCHSSGKSRTCAAAVLWFLARFENCMVITTAPTELQVKKNVWGEIRYLVTSPNCKYPYPVPNVMELQIGPKRQAYGFSTSVTDQNEGVRFQGTHAEHVLIVIDEAPGVNPKIWGAIDGIRAGGDVRILAPGNPTMPSGPFKDAFDIQEDGHGSWNAFTISAFDTPNFEGIYLRYVDQESGKEVILGDSEGRDLLKLSDSELDTNPRSYLTTKRWVKEKFYDWGPGHYLWDSRVLGNFPSQSEDSLISMDWIEAASSSAKESVGRVSIGIDVAGPGEDETVMVARRGPRVILNKAWANPDPRGDIMAELKKFDRNDIAVINVDSAGIGWGMFTHLRDEYKEQVVPINVGESPSNRKASEKYVNLKAELYWGLRERFKVGEIAGELDGPTRKQLSTIRYGPNSKGKTEIESKEDMRKRGVRSPDRAEAIMLAFADVNQMILGALTVIQENGIARVEASKVMSSTTIKPAVAENTESCPECGSRAVVSVAGAKHCNQCGTEFSQRALLHEPARRGSGMLTKIGR